MENKKLERAGIDNSLEKSGYEKQRKIVYTQSSIWNPGCVYLKWKGVKCVCKLMKMNEIRGKD